MIYLSNTSSNAGAFFFSEVKKGENFPFMTSIRSSTPLTRADISSCRQFSFLAISETYRLHVVASWFRGIQVYFHTLTS